jgi:hypothetical protein
METIRGEQVRGIHACEYRFLADGRHLPLVLDFWRIIHPPGSPNADRGVWQDVTEVDAHAPGNEMRMLANDPDHRAEALGEVVAGVALNQQPPILSLTISLSWKKSDHVDAVRQRRGRTSPGDKRGMGREVSQAISGDITPSNAASRFRRVISCMKEFSRSRQASKVGPLPWVT